MHRGRRSAPRTPVSARRANDSNTTVVARTNQNLDASRRETRRLAPAPAQTESTNPEEEWDDIGVHYNEYLTCHAINANDLIDKRARAITSQVASLAVMKEVVEPLFLKYHRRSCNITDLSLIDNQLKKQINEVDNFLNNNEMKVVKTLDNIYGNLQNSDKLETIDIIIPEEPSELELLNGCLRECKENLQYLMESLLELSTTTSELVENIKEYEKAVGSTDKLLNLTCKSSHELQYNILKTISTILEKICRNMSIY